MVAHHAAPCASNVPGPVMAMSWRPLAKRSGCGPFSVKPSHRERMAGYFGPISFKENHRALLKVKRHVVHHVERTAQVTSGRSPDHASASFLAIGNGPAKRIGAGNGWIIHRTIGGDVEDEVGDAGGMRRGRSSDVRNQERQPREPASPQIRFEPDTDANRSPPIGEMGIRTAGDGVPAASANRGGIGQRSGAALLPGRHQTVTRPPVSAD